MNTALKAHKILKCSGVTRSDFKFFKNKFYLLEINTQPGMTKLSLVPEIAAFKGISFIKLIELILKMQLRLNNKILFYIFLIIFLSTLNNKFFSEIRLKTVDKITIKGLEGKEKRNLMNDLELFDLKNIFFK